MLDQAIKDVVTSRLLPRVQGPARYLGGEVNAVLKDHRRVRGRLCLAFPDAYSIGMSHHGLQVLYGVMNARSDWACERVFAPGTDMEALLREQGVPLYGLESFTPLSRYDVVGFTLQHELGATNLLTILDLGGIPLRAPHRDLRHPLVIAGGPCAHNPEPLARFIDLFVVGDGEETLPAVCDLWLEARGAAPDRTAALAEIARRVPGAYAPALYREEYDGDGRALPPCPALPDLPAVVRPAVLGDLDAMPLPTRPVVPYVECVQDRIAIEIMRGCPWRCRFCQSTTTKRPLRFRRVETIVRAALESYRNTGYNEVSLLSLSTSDYPHFDALITRLQEELRPLGVSISVPSLRVNHQWRLLAEQLSTDRRSGLTLAPEAARDDMRRQIGKAITNDDLLEGCRLAFGKGFQRVKLYFMCGLPGERREDLDGIVDLAEEISRLGRQVTGRPATVVASVSNFVPKPQTPFQWHGMQSPEYFEAAHRRLKYRKRMRSVQVKYHDLATSLLEGLVARGDRRVGEAIEAAWRRGARFDSWTDRFDPDLWRDVLGQSELDLGRLVHASYPDDAPLPWDHVGIRQGRTYLTREHGRSLGQLAEMRASAGCARPQD